MSLRLRAAVLPCLLTAVVACGEVSSPGTIDAPPGGSTDAPPPAGTCTDGVKNGTESDVDCGPGCQPCADGRACTGASNCASQVCTNQVCQAATCSDGVRNRDELDVDCAGHCGAGSCEGGQACAAPADCASNLCVNNRCVAQKRVFVSSAIYSAGSIGNLAGGDAKCQALAAAAGLTGTYKAWLSTTSENAKDRMSAATSPYVLVDGTKVGDNFADVIDGTLDNAINRTETGAVPQASESICDANLDWVHTGTRPDGTLYDANNNCANFTADTGGGAFGRFGSLGSGWMWSCGGGAPVNYCGKRAHIYCFEQ